MTTLNVTEARVPTPPPRLFLWVVNFQTPVFRARQGGRSDSGRSSTEGDTRGLVDTSVQT